MKLKICFAASSKITPRVLRSSTPQPPPSAHQPQPSASAHSCYWRALLPSCVWSLYRNEIMMKGNGYITPSSFKKSRSWAPHCRHQLVPLLLHGIPPTYTIKPYQQHISPASWRRRRSDDFHPHVEKIICTSTPRRNQRGVLLTSAKLQSYGRLTGMRMGFMRITL